MYCFSSLEEFAALRDSIKEELAQCLGTDALRLFVAVNESVNNAILHGNQEDPDKKVHLNLVKLPNVIEIIIRDEGNGFSEAETAGETELWKEDGRGLEMMRYCVDSYRLNSIGNEITLVKKISKL